MSLPCATLMCHAPIVIPEIARQRAAACAMTTHAMRAAAARLVAHQPDVTLVLTPHAPRLARAWTLSSGEVRGNFQRFGHPELGLSFVGDATFEDELEEALDAHGIERRWVEARDLDHGACVPLHFIQEAGFQGAVIAVGFPVVDDHETRFGEALHEALNASRRRVAVLASGDMSHCLKPGAPSGYHPAGARFDSELARWLRIGDVKRACRIPPHLTERAAEDVMASLKVAFAACGKQADGCRVLAYEGPFGVGYLEAILHEPLPLDLCRIAREAIAAKLGGRAFTPPRLPAAWSESRGTFVTLRTRSGELRGCIGHMQSHHRTLAEEVADCAVRAATADPRFLPLALKELTDVRIEVSVLGELEEVTGEDLLDPKRFGVTVTTDGRHGVLLPDIEGVDTVEEQLQIVRRKAGIADDEPATLRRFRVQKVREAAPRAA